MKVSVHLSFNGQCAEAFAAYSRIFDGTVTFQMTYAESPQADAVPADWRDKVYHATMLIGDLRLMGVDQQTDYQTRQGFVMTVNPDTPDDARRIFDALGEGGTVQMEMQETFWSPAFGMVTDRFGIPWAVNCEVAAAQA